jgi:Transmembrane secretion effector
VLFAVLSWKRQTAALDTPLESFFDSLAGAVRYMRYAPGVRVILLRNLIFGILIGAIPALLPVVGLKALRLDALRLGFVFTSMALGSLAGAILILEPARKVLRPNQMTMLAGLVLALSYGLMAVVRQPQIFLLVAALSGAAWTVSASELWVAGQRIIPEWIRGRLNATHMMVSQGGISVAGLLWGALATALSLEWALFLAALLGVVSALTARRWSIDFSEAVNPEPYPLPAEKVGPYSPEPEDGPITTALEIEVAPENQLEFFRLMVQIRLVFLRNGAFTARLDQDMENPNRFRLYAIYPSWAALQRVGQRLTHDEHSLWSELWSLHVGPEKPGPRRFLGVQHWMPESSALARLKPTASASADEPAPSAEHRTIQGSEDPVGPSPM